MNKELNVITDWTDIPITFRTRCYECGEEILPGRAFGSESKKSAKHLRCGVLKSQIDDKTPAVSLDSKPTNTKVMGNLNTSLDFELKCFVCGKTAGCRACSYSTTCDRRIVSQLCICETCLNPKDKKDAFENYQNIFIRKASAYDKKDY
ncbi:MAG TPA: hypothetical protein VEH06_12710 [Candidatus Bathyarchaeia archaeon]|nr:hypothetical protein [Candidatus Bathyarchaeia archaeon]